MKADGCDINKGLKESTKLQWSGDVDLGDGSLQKQFQSYKLRLQKAEKLSVSRETAVEDLNESLSAINEDLKFIQSGTDVQLFYYIRTSVAAPSFFLEVVKSNNEYSQKLKLSKQNEKEMMTLAWKVKELSDVDEVGRDLFSNIKALLTKVVKQNSLTEENIPRQLKITRQKLSSRVLHDINALLLHMYWFL